MLCALAIRPGDQDLSKDALPKASAILSAFSGLVIIDEESQIVKLVHYTTEEYFQRKGDYRSPETHRQVACILITYLNSSTLTDAIFPRTTRIDHNSKVEAYKRAKEEILRQNVLLDYCAKHWGNHVRQALSCVDEVIMGSGLGTLTDTDHFEAKYRSLVWEIDRLFPALLASRSNMTSILKFFGILRETPLFFSQETYLIYGQLPTSESYSSPTCLLNVGTILRRCFSELPQPFKQQARAT